MVFNIRFPEINIPSFWRQNIGFSIKCVLLPHFLCSVQPLESLYRKKKAESKAESPEPCTNCSGLLWHLHFSQLRYLFFRRPNNFQR